LRTILGLDVHRAIGGTGVVGVLQRGTETRCIGLRADMDRCPSPSAITCLRSLCSTTPRFISNPKNGVSSRQLLRSPVIVAAPETVARDAYRGIMKNRAVVYTPFFWAGIMWIIRMIPDFVFRRLNL